MFEFLSFLFLLLVLLPLAFILVACLVIKGFIFSVTLFFRLGFGFLQALGWVLISLLLFPFFLLLFPLILPLAILALLLLALPFIVLFSLFGFFRPC